MKRVLPLMFLLIGFGLVSLGCGDEFDDEGSGSIGGTLTLPRALLDMNVSKIQVIVLESGSGRNAQTLRRACQKSNLGQMFQKDDLVRVVDGGDKRLSFVKEISKEALEAGTKLKIELETGTNYLFIFEIFGTGAGNALQLLANGSAAYEQVSKGSDNKSIAVTLNDDLIETSECADPLFNG
ncbi:MAG: hypothetical protein LBM75_03150 [Myxococcales bacterium]|jgi:hypothetical protein|nr:hypothetical protein [Myxococcales bacterium]